jgi:hypothetical protein
MIDYDAYMLAVQARLRHMVEQRPFRFVETKRRLAEAYLAQQVQCIGYREDEICNLEYHLSVTFPSVFRAYLRVFGHARSTLFIGSDTEPTNLTLYRTQAAELIAESNAEPTFLTADTVVFMFHQGYSFCYFHTLEDENPRIASYTEGDAAPRKDNGTFIEFLESELVLQEKVHLDQLEAGGYFVQVKERSVQMTYPARDTKIRPIDVGDRYTDDESNG